MASKCKTEHFDTLDSVGSYDEVFSGRQYSSGQKVTGSLYVRCRYAWRLRRCDFCDSRLAENFGVLEPIYPESVLPIIKTSVHDGLVASRNSFRGMRYRRKYAAVRDRFQM